MPLHNALRRGIMLDNSASEVLHCADASSRVLVTIITFVFKMELAERIHVPRIADVVFGR